MTEVPEVMFSTDLHGRRVELRVGKQKPSVISIGAYGPLIETVQGKLEQFVYWPGGPVGLLTADDGRKIAFDAGRDLDQKIIEIVVDKADQN